MQLNIAREVALLQRMTGRELKQKYAEVFGAEARAHNRPWLIRRIAWRLQALSEGDLSERARQRAVELANDADLRLAPPKTMPDDMVPALPPPPPRYAKQDDRLPIAGSVLTRMYRGKQIQVKVLDKGFEFEGTYYKSLSAAAKAITNSHCSGFYFFGLEPKGEDQ